MFLRMAGEPLERTYFAVAPRQLRIQSALLVLVGLRIRKFLIKPDSGQS